MRGHQHEPATRPVERSEGRPEERPIGREPNPWALAALVMVVTRIPLCLFAWVIDHFRPWVLRSGHFLYHGAEPHSNWLVDAFQKWDAYWFLNIVRNGYQFHGIQEQIDRVVAGVAETNITPFPLYPLLMKGLGLLLGDYAVAGLVISQACLFLAMVMLYRLARLDMTTRGAETVVWAFALVPWTYAFTAIYSESLFFFCTVAAVLAGRKDRLWLAGLAGMGAAASRLLGVMVFVPLVMEACSNRRQRSRWFDFKLFGLLLVPLGTVAYFAYLWRLTGEPLAYFVAQSGWHKELVGIWYHPLKWLGTSILEGEDYLHIFTTAVTLVILYFGFRRVRWSYWTYAVVYFAILMSSTYLLGLPRYVAGLFPIYLILGSISERYPTAVKVVLLLFAMSVPIVFHTWTTWSYAY